MERRIDRLKVKVNYREYRSIHYKTGFIDIPEEIKHNEEWKIDHIQNMLTVMHGRYVVWYIE